ncbi:MAG TPA: divalent-cation tolerance protein CutA [Candidatus Binataceae bacterium]|jgi:periplasmic divalent cation tolerance protein|nr:divalent-cation tolerance protein CutA [Candidatus Binataceae bacterium]
MARAATARVVLVMAGTAAEARKIARRVVEERLAACVNIVGPLSSIYRWQGRIESAREHLLIIKTRSSLFRTLENRVRQLHSYDVPEIIALPLAGGSSAYLNWLLDSTGPARNNSRRLTR